MQEQHDLDCSWLVLHCVRAADRHLYRPGEQAPAGVKVYLYEKGYLHAKILSIDGEVCSIGSANLDIRSFSINYELNAVLYDARLATELETTFERDLDGCRVFGPAEYEQRSVARRLRDSVARLLSPLM